MGDESPRPLDGGDIAAPLRAYMVNAPAGSMSKSKPEDTTLLEDEVIPLESDGYHGGRLDNLPPEKPKSLSETRKAVMAEYKEARIKNEAEAMLNKPGVTIAELEELEHRHMAEYMRCYMKIRAVNDESNARLLEIRGEAADLLKRVYAGEEVSTEDQVRCLERMLELCQ